MEILVSLEFGQFCVQIWYIVRMFNRDVRNSNEGEQVHA